MSAKKNRNKEIVVLNAEGEEIDRFKNLTELAEAYGLKRSSVAFILDSKKISKTYGFALRYEEITVKTIEDPEEFARLIPLYPKFISNDGLAKSAGLTSMGCKSKVNSISDDYLICEDDIGMYSRMKPLKGERT